MHFVLKLEKKKNNNPYTVSEQLTKASRFIRIMIHIFFFHFKPNNWISRYRPTMVLILLLKENCKPSYNIWKKIGFMPKSQTT